MIELDVRGLDCPEPSKIVASVIEERRPERLKVVTDNEDCEKMLRVMVPLLGYRVKSFKSGEEFVLVFEKE